jgi:aryl carrier-like protein
LAAAEASFVSSLPWADGGGITRAYRTGDLVRYLPDGELLFLGRKDNQVKINGRRIELEEIEACICRSPLVARASVQLRNIGDSAILAAFLVPQGATKPGDEVCNLLDGSEHDFHALFDDLRERLPAYMAPEYLIPVNCIPRMTSGKVDQHTLAAILDQARLVRHHSGDSDRNEEDQELSESYKTMRDLWAKVLDIPPGSIFTSDRFLHLGGNSIKAMKLVSEARVSGIKLTVKELLKNCTVDELNHSRQGEPVTEKAVGPRSELQSPSPQSYTPTWIQMVAVSTVSGFPEGNYVHIVIDLRGRLDLVRLRETCRSLVQKNEVLRTQFSLRNGTIEATVLDELEVPFLHFTSRSEALEHWESVPPNCFDRQLATFSYVVMDENSTHFALGIQHSQYDAWTVTLLLRQLQSIYHGHEVCPGPPFSAFAARVPQATNPEAERFWKEQSANLPMTLLSDSSAEGDEPDRNFQKSLRLSPSGFTFATVIYSAWALVLSKHAKTGRVVFGGAVSGRNIDMEGILEVVGPCINMLPFPIDITKCETYLEVLQSVQDTMIATVPYESMPMPDIIARCADWSPTAVFGSIVQHLDITFDLPAFSQAQCEGDSGMLEWNYLVMKKRYGRCRATDIYVFSTISRKGFADVQFKFNPSRITPDLAEILFGDLCGNIEAVLHSAEQKISRDF